MQAIGIAVWAVVALGVAGQGPVSSPVPGPPVAALKSGVDAGSNIAYALVSIAGKLVGGGPAESTPRLTAQCTRDAAGKLRFELLADAGDVPELSYYPPWKPASRDDLFPPSLPKVTATMEFLGYTKVKPMKRTWVYLKEPAGEAEYAAPGARTVNMEPASFYMQYLKALPTLRLTLPNVDKSKPAAVLEFETTRWQAAIKAEPLCGASGL